MKKVITRTSCIAKCKCEYKKNRREHNLSDPDVREIASMQREIDCYEAVLMHWAAQITDNNHCHYVVIDPVSEESRGMIKTIQKFLDEHTNTNTEQQ